MATTVLNDLYPMLDPGPAADALCAGAHAHPHDLLGPHPVGDDARRASRAAPAAPAASASSATSATVVRAYHPAALAIELLREGEPPLPMSAVRPGLFAVLLEETHARISYRLRLRFHDGAIEERDDPYRFAPTIGEQDLYYFAEATHARLWDVMGAHVRRIDGVDGVAFTVWAPNAQRVAVVGDFCHWDGGVLPMRCMGSSGIYELFVPGLGAGTLYKYEIRTQDGALRVKADPYAQAAELPPNTASRVTTSSHEWHDDDWLEQRARKDMRGEPLSIYEVHLGSWKRGEDGRTLGYRELAPLLADHAQRYSFTHVELMPVAEHPFDGSWGYQVTGYFAPTSRFGTPDDFRFLVDHLHSAGIGVIIDWVPAHFPKDDFALRRFDGTALYEHDDPRLGEHPDWGTLIFNYGRKEVRSFLIASALYWLDELHVDGLRVDAVASMLYLDYSREHGEWLPNRYGGRENLDAIELIQSVNQAVVDRYPGCMMIAEESTAWTGVTQPTSAGGLGFTLKWNMGWMHDTLRYFSRDPLFRCYHHNDLTFAMLYEHSEHFVMPLSHDEVVHGKRSLLSKMPGDEWQQFANLRALLAYQYTRPGKNLLFMGTELAPWDEWSWQHELDWGLWGHDLRRQLSDFLAALGSCYRDEPAFWRWDGDGRGFEWLVVEDSLNSALAYARHFEDRHVVVVLNLSPNPREGYRIGVPRSGGYRCVLSSDDERFGGSRFETPSSFGTEPVPAHGREQSVVLQLPPLGALVLAPATED